MSPSARICTFIPSGTLQIWKSPRSSAFSVVNGSIPDARMSDASICAPVAGDPSGRNTRPTITARPAPRERREHICAAYSSAVGASNATRVVESRAAVNDTLVFRTISSGDNTVSATATT